MNECKLFVGFFDRYVTSEHLSRLFSVYGQVRKVTMKEDKGFAFIEMASAEEAERAIEALNGSVLEGNTIKVEQARPPRYKIDEDTDIDVDIIEH